MLKFFISDLSLSIFILTNQPIEKMKNQNFTQQQQDLLRNTFKAVADHCLSTGNNDEKSHRKELNKLINLHLRWNEDLETAVENSYWNVISAIDIDNQLNSES